MLNLEDMTEESVKNIVMELDQVSSFDIPPTVRLTDKFLVAKKHLLLKDYYGPMMVYDLKHGEEVAKFSFEWDDLHDIASDGNGDREEIYLHMKGGDFNVREEDILLGKIMHWTDEKDGDGQDYRDGMCEFIGKPARELKGDHQIYGEANKNGIVGRIESFSLKNIIHSNPRLIWDPSRFTKRNKRFLVHEDMASVSLSSEEGHVIVHYNYHYGEGGCGESIQLKDGIAQPHYFNNDEDRGYLTISESRISPHGFYSEISFLDPESSQVEVMTNDIPFNIIFKGGKIPPTDLGGILGIQHTEKELHVLRDHVFYKDGDNGSWEIQTPARMDSYDISFKKVD